MNKFIFWFIAVCIGTEVIAWAFDGVRLGPEWMLYALAMIALRIAYLFGKADQGPQ